MIVEITYSHRDKWKSNRPNGEILGDSHALSVGLTTVIK